MKVGALNSAFVAAIAQPLHQGNSGCELPCSVKRTRISVLSWAVSVIMEVEQLTDAFVDCELW